MRWPSPSCAARTRSFWISLAKPPGAAFGVTASLLTPAVFAGTPERGIGLAYMLGPTGGYLLGYPLAVALTGWIAERRRDAAGLALAVAAGYLAIYIPGLLWLAKFVGFEAVLGVGLAPFVWGDLLKATLAWALGGPVQLGEQQRGPVSHLTVSIHESPMP